MNAPAVAARRTPGPWELIGSRHIRSPLQQEDGRVRGGLLIAELPPEGDGGGGNTANAAFIVLACNAHDELIERAGALQRRVSWLEKQNDELVAALRKIKSVGDDNKTALHDAFAMTMYGLATDALAKVAQP